MLLLVGPCFSPSPLAMDAATAALLLQQVQAMQRRIDEFEAERDARESHQDRRGQRQILDRRTAMTVRKYSGNPSEWRDWSLCFKRLIRTMEDVVYKTMNTIEDTAIGEIDEDLEFSGTGEEDAIRRKSSGELFDLLCSLCEGEASAIVTATEDCKGFVAWQRLANKCNARTMARAIKLVSLVTGPPKIRSIKDVESELTKWEEKVKVLEREFKESFSPMVKIGIMTSIMPAEIQDQVYNTIEPNSSYEVITARIRTVVGNKVAMM